MNYSIADIAVLMEGETIYEAATLNEQGWLAGGPIMEARPETYLNFFNKSTAPAVAVNPMRQLQATQAGQKPAPPPMLKDLSPEQKLQLIQQIQAVVDPALARYEQYFVRQVAAGHMAVDKVQEDSERLNNTIKLFLKFSRKANWEGSKNILDYPNWRVLEKQVREHEDKNIEYDDRSNDSEVLFEKTYVNNAISLLLGGPPEVSKYWFRVVRSVDAACKYGKGTQWCTASKYDPEHAAQNAARAAAGQGYAGYQNRDEWIKNHYAATYLNRSGLYIVELQTPKRPRRPILQISGDDMMNPEDVPIERYGPRLMDFLKEVLARGADKINPKSVQAIQDALGGNRTVDYEY